MTPNYVMQTKQSKCQVNHSDEGAKQVSCSLFIWWREGLTDGQRQVILAAAYVTMVRARTQYYAVIFLPVTAYVASTNSEHEEHTGARTVTTETNGAWVQESNNCVFPPQHFRSLWLASWEYDLLLFSISSEAQKSEGSKRKSYATKKGCISPPACTKQRALLSARMCMKIISWKTKEDTSICETKVWRLTSNKGRTHMVLAGHCLIIVSYKHLFTV